MIRSVLAAFLVVTLAAVARSALAGEDAKLPRIGGAVPVDRATDAPYQRALREGFRELGYVDGKNIVLVWRYADGDPARLRAIIKELVDMRVDVLMGDARQLKEATTSIPIVSMTMGDPVKTGLVASLAHPGGNLTGVSTQSYDLWPKQLQFARELVPELSRVGFLFDTSDEPGALTNSAEFGRFAREAGIAVLALPVSSLGDINRALKTIHKERPEALVIWSSPLLQQHRHTIISSIGHRMPVISDVGSFAEAGALLTYSVDWPDLFRRSASYVDKILRGAKPGDLPIEQPTKFELVVNLRTAKALHVKVPQSILVRADKVIE